LTHWNAAVEVAAVVTAPFATLLSRLIAAIVVVVVVVAVAVLR